MPRVLILENISNLQYSILIFFHFFIMSKNFQTVWLKMQYICKKLIAIYFQDLLRINYKFASRGKSITHSITVDILL